MKRLFIGFFLTSLLLGCSTPKTAVRQPDSPVKPGVYFFDGMVTFVYVPADPSVKKVAITGDFNGWNPAGIALHATSGIFTVSLKLEPGIYQYKYILNETNWVSDPYSPSFAPDGRGGKNSLIEVKKT